MGDTEGAEEIDLGSLPVALVGWVTGGWTSVEVGNCFQMVLNNVKPNKEQIKNNYSASLGRK